MSDFKWASERSVPMGSQPAKSPSNASICLPHLSYPDTSKSYPCGPNILSYLMRHFWFVAINNRFLLFL